MPEVSPPEVTPPPPSWQIMQPVMGQAPTSGTPQPAFDPGWGVCQRIISSVRLMIRPSELLMPVRLFRVSPAGPRICACISDSVHAYRITYSLFPSSQRALRLATCVQRATLRGASTSMSLASSEQRAGDVEQSAVTGITQG